MVSEWPLTTVTLAVMGVRLSHHGDSLRPRTTAALGLDL